MIDPKDPRDRILMFLPGFITWTLILLPIWLGFIAPRIAAFVLTFVAIYWVFTSYKHAVDLIRGYREYKEESKVNWHEKCIKLDGYRKIKHFVLIPTYREGFQILEATFKGIMDQTIPTEKILVVIGTEEAGEEMIKESLAKLRKRYGEKLPKILHYIHPKGIPGEIVGVASPNRTWAARHAVEYLKEQGESISNYVFTTFDSDTIAHPEFLARITYLYLTDDKPFNHFFQTTTMLFDNNIWKVPLMSRIESNLVTIGMMSTWNREIRFAETYSCYSCALQTVIDANYWDVRFIDDTVFFWRAYIARRGDFSAKYFRIPISADATGGETYLIAHKNLFRQLIRWGWGSVGTVIALKTILSHTKAGESTLEKKLLWLILKIERHTLQRASTFLMTFGFVLITVVNRQFKNTSTVYGLPQILSLFLTGALFMFIPITLIRRKLYPTPANMPAWEKALRLLEGPMVLINLLTYSFIPWMIAETQMMFGKLPKVTFYTPKIR